MANKDWGQKGRKDLMMFLPEQVVLVTDPKDALFDPRALNKFKESMVQDIMENGVITPVVITPREPSPAIVVGRQRHINLTEANRRLREAGAEEHWLPCVWRKGGDDAALLGVVVSENAHTEPVSLMQQCQLALRLETMGRSVAQIAIRMNITAQAVRDYLNIAVSEPAVKKAITDKKITQAMAAEVARAPKEKQKALLAKIAASGATKGAGGLKAAKAAREDRDITKEKVVNLMGKKFLVRLKAAFGKIQTTINGEELLEFLTGEIELSAVKDADTKRAIKEALAPVVLAPKEEEESSEEAISDGHPEADVL